VENDKDGTLQGREMQRKYGRPSLLFVAGTALGKATVVKGTLLAAAVAQLVEALRYKPAGRGFDSQ
jgi:hypothetical protein